MPVCVSSLSPSMVKTRLMDSQLFSFDHLQKQLKLILDLCPSPSSLAAINNS